MITLSSSEKEVVRRCEESFNNGIAFIAKLLTFPSTAGNEADAQMFVADELRSLGMATDIWEPDQEELENHPAFITQRENFHESPNVVGVLKGCGQGRSLILNAHIDVVPEGDPETWKYGPWSGKVCDGRVYGRGASDMKGGLAAIVHALRCITGHGIRLRGDVIVESVVAEEDGGAGTLACALRGYKADAAIIPEPSQMKIFPAVQGSKWFRVIVEGVPAHGGSRFDGISALEKAIRIHNGIIDLENYRAKKIRHPLYAKPVPFPINIGKISGGTWPSAVPGSVTLEGRIGVAPGETIEEAQHMMEKWIREEASHDPWLCDHLPKVEFFGAHWRPSDIPLDHPIITLTREIYENFAGQPEITGAPWGTDGGILMDYASTPALVFGPGTTEMAHKVDEYLELDNLLAYIKILSLIIMRWCGVE